MPSMYDRTQMLVGEQNMNKIKHASIIVFGVGGVGGYTIEALVRAGIGRLCIVDFDKVDITNINRQIIATTKTVGRFKTEVMAERAKEINPDIDIKALCTHFPRERLSRLEENADESISRFALDTFDYIVDAIDDVKAKLLLIEESKRLGVPLISSMGTGNKKDPFQFKIADIAKTHTCPLAKSMRKELSKRGIKGVKVLFSEELPERVEEGTSPASISYNPAAAGLMIAAEVVKDILEESK